MIPIDFLYVFIVFFIAIASIAVISKLWPPKQAIVTSALIAAMGAIALFIGALFSGSLVI